MNLRERTIEAYNKIGKKEEDQIILEERKLLSEALETEEDKIDFLKVDLPNKEAFVRIEDLILRTDWEYTNLYPFGRRYEPHLLSFHLLDEKFREISHDRLLNLSDLGRALLQKKKLDSTA